MKPFVLFPLLLIPLLAFLVPAQSTKGRQKSVLPPGYALDVIDEINGIRQNPSKYSGYLERYLRLLRGDVIYLPKRKPFRLQEGANGLTEAAKFLAGSDRMLPLMRSELLESAAAAQLADLLQNPNLGHVGKDGADLGKRLDRFGKRGGPASENITYWDETPRQVALTMIMDDGVESRAHRKNVMNADFRAIGVACGSTPEDQNICVTIFASQFVPLGTAAPALVPEEFE